MGAEVFSEVALDTPPGRIGLPDNAVRVAVGDGAVLIGDAADMATVRIALDRIERVVVGRAKQSRWSRVNYWVDIFVAKRVDKIRLSPRDPTDAMPDPGAQLYDTILAIVAARSASNPRRAVELHTGGVGMLWPLAAFCAAVTIYIGVKELLMGRATFQPVFGFIAFALTAAVTAYAAWRSRPRSVFAGDPAIERFLSGWVLS